MAHAICVAELARRNLAIEVYSAGVCDFTDLPPVYETINTCRNHNTPVAKEESTFVASLRLDKIDRFLAMEQHHADALIVQFGVSADRVSLLAEFDPQDRGRNIADPIGQGSAVYEKCYRQIRECIINYLDTISSLSA
jgi:protein-tyrosine-phosphatase